jgi:riboflavin transporter FmnP
MEEKTIIRIPAMPFALMWGAIEAAIGLIAGVIAAIFWTSIMSWATSLPNYQGPPLTGLGVIFGIGAIVIFPIMGFIGGLLQGLIFAVVYNFLAPRIGGIKLHFKEESRPSAPP